MTESQVAAAATPGEGLSPPGLAAAGRKPCPAPGLSLLATPRRATGDAGGDAAGPSTKGGFELKPEFGQEALSLGPRGSLSEAGLSSLFLLGPTQPCTRL